jgi:hypothetical protein
LKTGAFDSTHDLFLQVDEEKSWKKNSSIASVGRNITDPKKGGIKLNK